MRPSATTFRFAGVGALNTVLDLGLYTILTTRGVDVFVANLASTSAGLCLSFVLNNRFTFRQKTVGVRKPLLFLAFTGVGLWILQPVVIVAATPVSGLFSALLSAIVPKCIAICVGLVWNYAAYRFVVFRTPSPFSGSRAPAPDPTMTSPTVEGVLER